MNHQGTQTLSAHREDARARGGLERLFGMALLLAGCSGHRVDHDAGDAATVDVASDTNEAFDASDVHDASTSDGSDAVDPDAGDANDAQDTADVVIPSDGGDAGTPRPSVIATVEQEGSSPALYVQALDGTGRRRVHFDHVEPGVPGLDDPSLAVTDASILAMPFLSFSPDGSQLAVVVSVNPDLSEIVRVDLDTGIGHVASHNGYYVMGAPDWSPDASHLSYARSTGFNIRNTLELFTSSTNAETQVTHTGGLPELGNGLNMHVRYNTAADTLFFVEVPLGTGSPLWDNISNVERVPLSTRVIAAVSAELVGSAWDIRRDGSVVLLGRRLSYSTDGTVDLQLLERNVSTRAETVLLPHGNIIYAEYDQTGGYAHALIDHWTTGVPVHSYAWQRVDIAHGTVTTIEVPAVATNVTRSALFIAGP